MGRFFLYLYGTFLGTGFAPIAPATVASFAVALVWWLAGPLPLALQALLLAVVTAVGVPVATRLEVRHGHDPKLVVCDEVAGMIVTYLGVSLFARPVTLLGVTTTGLPACLAGFLWFRVFDILKPFPARRFESLPRGWGIMADDLMAGVYAQIALRLTMRWLGW